MDLQDFIAQVQALRLPPSSPVSRVLDEMLEAILVAGGPPSQPIDNFSEGLRTAIARSPKGRPLFLAHTWSTAPWTCLLIDLPPTPMGRPIFIRNPNTGLGRVSIDYRSQKFQKRIVAACQALDVPPPPAPSRLAIQVDSHRVFLAWTAYTLDYPAIPGDLDNYAKNVMDALQRGRIVQNDRTIASFTAIKANIPAAVRSLDDVLSDKIREILKDHPRTSVKTLAKKGGMSFRKASALVRVIRREADELAEASARAKATAGAAAGGAENPQSASAAAAAAGATPKNSQAGDRHFVDDFTAEAKQLAASAGMSLPQLMQDMIAEEKNQSAGSE